MLILTVKKPYKKGSPKFYPDYLFRFVGDKGADTVKAEPLSVATKKISRHAIM